MIKLYLAIGLLLSQVSVCFSQTEAFYVKPIYTDSNYASDQDSNYVAINTATNLNKLVLFLGGTYSRPDNYSIICQYAASLGFDVISLSYPNNVAAALLGGSSDSLAFNKYRQEICFGTPLSFVVSVDTLNSIYTRSLKLIQYLAVTYPAQNWGQYLAAPDSVDWSKIVVAGHSQGSGHACYLGKTFPVERVLMFSGPNDYSTFYTNSANWLRQSGLTPTSKHFALLHLEDEIVPFSEQYANLAGLGMLAADDSTLVDNLSPPYGFSHFLYTDIPAFSNHVSTVGGNASLPPVWNYMLTSSLTTGIEDRASGEGVIKVYPNPTTSLVTIEVPENSKADYLRVFNSRGQVVLRKRIVGKTLIHLDISAFSNGLYYIKIGDAAGKIVKN